MNLFNKLRDKLDEFIKEREEKAAFRKYVDEQTKPIRRAAFLNQKMAQAIEEGEAIAKKEVPVAKPKTEDNPFGLPDLSKFVNTDPYFKQTQPTKKHMEEK